MDLASASGKSPIQLPCGASPEWLPGTKRVAPFSWVKSSTAQMAFRPHWSGRCSGTDEVSTTSRWSPPASTPEARISSRTSQATHSADPWPCSGRKVSATAVISGSCAKLSRSSSLSPSSGYRNSWVLCPKRTFWPSPMRPLSSSDRAARTVSGLARDSNTTTPSLASAAATSVAEASAPRRRRRPPAPEGGSGSAAASAAATPARSRRNRSTTATHIRPLSRSNRGWRRRSGRGGGGGMSSAVAI
mmetsp:Transcript_30712/g.91219  ORF Transcript_30712/g.91219 Transcript_30712/m.91219 type:complete len:246 (-) Transcript_30712:44-781(-)